MHNRLEKSKVEVVGLLGVGLDGTDNQKRITQSEQFLLIGGSAETHERMQETAIRFEEALEKRGKTLREAEPQEVMDLLRDAQRK
ncbi:hypothetical protein KIH39_03835 [Telmatocola sphagniphila]|jgi:hypothetical protein|uniref:Uncharacterized protein n=1 Tax=Telmatocola sphagniphila TaxID=1123043 RepID=A0A8E6B702_9BACT|nr:hypothetical protein [Telmatocola sphagniphila]QVL33057.1 hypothetical protein KIH39_03835 [Telmatocola sphagniphila]